MFVDTVRLPQIVDINVQMYTLVQMAGFCVVKQLNQDKSYLNVFYIYCNNATYKLK